MTKDFLNDLLIREVDDAIEKAKQLNKDELTMQDYCEYIDWLFIDEQVTSYIKELIEERR